MGTTANNGELVAVALAFHNNLFIRQSEILIKSYISKFQADFSNRWLGYLLLSRPQAIGTEPQWWFVNTGPGNGWVS